VRLDDLAVGVLQQVAQRPMQDPRLPLGERCAMPAELRTGAARLDADQLDAGGPDEGREHADRVGAAPHTRQHVARIRSAYCARASSPITRCRSRTSIGKGCGPTTEPIT